MLLVSYDILYALQKFLWTAEYSPLNKDYTDLVGAFELIAFC